MVDVIKYTAPDGDLHIVEVSPEWEGTLQAIIAKDVPPGSTNIEIVDRSVLPSDRIFRGAWNHVPGGVGIDMSKARDIAREKVRRARDAEFPANDAAYLKGLQDNDNAAQAQAKARATALRNAPADPAIDNAQNPNALKAVRPAGLDWTRF